FYSTPRLSPDGRRLCWLSWQHPNMPWDANELWVANFNDEGALFGPRQVPSSGRESFFQPEWGSNGALYFVWDRSSWWNLYRADQSGVVPLMEMAAEFGAPHWVFDTRTYALLPDGRILAAYSQSGTSRLGLVDPKTQ